VPANHATLFKVLLSVGSVLLVLAVPELVLRAIGFQYEAGVAFLIPEEDEAFVAFEPDPHLLFKFDPSHPKVNSLGFPDDEVVLPKPHGVFRMLFLGDSCTQQGLPDEVAERLALSSEASFDAVTLAVAGYSSYQGRVMAERIAGDLEGDLAVVYFGWNDHWLAHGAPDSKKIAVQTEVGAIEGLVNSLRERSRLMQGLVRLQVELRRRGDPASAQLRVPIAEYRSNLEAIATRLDALGMPVVFVTAPTSHYSLGVPAELVRDRFAANRESVPQLHVSYNRVVRKVARETGSGLLDLEKDMRDFGPARLSKLFTEDGIHFTSEGLRFVGRRIARYLREQELTPD
jgi:lysophospholipase L1-like esterase